MANIDITDAVASLSNGLLQLENGVAMDTTLRYVADQLNTKSQLLLATNATTVEGTLKIKTSNVEYLDVEDALGNNRFTISKAVGSQKVDLDFASNPTGSTTIVGAIRTYQDGINLSDIVKFREDGQTTFVERVNIEADSLVTTQTSSVIASTTTNANLVIAPNGTGALIADIPDGTATGGNARGTNAVDLQTSRTGATNIASGQNATISGGSTNTASSAFSTVSGGQSNTASTGTHATVVGGQSNTSSGQHSVSGGINNVASGGDSTAFGIQNIVSGTNGSFSAGQQNTVSGAFNAAFGAANNVGGSRNFAAGGSNVLTGDYNGAIGFNNSVSSSLPSFAVGSTNESSTYGFASGFRAVTIGYASRVLSNSGFGNEKASSQIREMIANREAVLTSGATTTLSLDGTGITNLISTLYDVNRMWNVTLKYVAVIKNITGTATGVTIGDIKTQNIELAVKRVITVTSIVGGGSYSIAQEDASMNSATLTPSITGNDLILTFTAPTFVGGGSVTCRVVAKVELVEIGYA